MTSVVQRIGEALFAGVGILSASLAAAQEREAAIVRTGSFVFNVKVIIRSDTPKDAKIYCSVNAEQRPASQTASRRHSEGARASAKRTGKGAECRVIIPFRWTDIDPKIPIEVRLQVIAITSEGLASLIVPAREVSQDIPKIKLPPEGGTRVFPVNIDF